MNDWEKIITHLDDMRLFADTRVHPIVSTENWGIYSDLCNFIDLVKEEILVLMKEHGAVKPKSKVRHGANAQIQHFCGNCMALLHGKPKYCSECGRKMQWNE